MRKFYVCKGFEDRGVILPKRGTSHSAGYDFTTIDDVDIEPGERKMISTGVKAQMDDDDVLLIFPRSSLAVKKGLRLSNSVAVIDADYFSNPDNDGHIMINLFNFSKDKVHLDKGQRFAQGIFVKYGLTEDDASSSTRKGGYGSTGEK
jgi:dUTP pyrophosphatase